MIPEAAVEAAAKCLPGYDPHWGGEEADRAENEALRSRARQMLQAAAPHMLAEAWDEGIQDADDQGYLYEHQSDFMKSRNPYRTPRG